MGSLCDGGAEEPAQQEQARSLVYKVIMLGAANVGKTSLIVQWSDRVFQENTPTFLSKTRALTVQGKKVNVDVPDTGGLEAYVSSLLFLTFSQTREHTDCFLLQGRWVPSSI